MIVVGDLNTVLKIGLKVDVYVIVVRLLPLHLFHPLELLLGVGDEQHLVSRHDLATAVEFQGISIGLPTLLLKVNNSTDLQVVEVTYTAKSDISHTLFEHVVDIHDS